MIQVEWFNQELPREIFTEYAARFLDDFQALDVLFCGYMTVIFFYPVVSKKYNPLPRVSANTCHVLHESIGSLTNVEKTHNNHYEYSSVNR